MLKVVRNDSKIEFDTHEFVDEGPGSLKKILNHLHNGGFTIFNVLAKHQYSKEGGVLKLNTVWVVVTQKLV